LPDSVSLVGERHGKRKHAFRRADAAVSRCLLCHAERCHYRHREAESLHVHKDHDLSVFVYRGHGIMRVTNANFAVKAGDVLFIPKAVPHAFKNQGTTPAVAIVVFTPAFDGKDTAPVVK